MSRNYFLLSFSLKYVLIFALFSCSFEHKRQMVVNLDSIEKERISLLQKDSSSLYFSFVNCICGNRRVLSLSKNIYISLNHTKDSFGPFYSYHEIIINKKKYTLQISNATPIITDGKFIYFPERYLVCYDIHDSISVIKLKLPTSAVAR